MKKIITLTFLAMGLSCNTFAAISKFQCPSLSELMNKSKDTWNCKGHVHHSSYWRCDQGSGIPSKATDFKVNFMPTISDMVCNYGDSSNGITVKGSLTKGQVKNFTGVGGEWKDDVEPNGKMCDSGADQCTWKF